MTDGGRHMACAACREKKVRCDGGQPSCKRCSRYSVQCVYMPAPKQSKVEADLNSLKERLHQAETTLAAQQGPSRGNPPPSTIFNYENATWPASAAPINAFSSTDLCQYFQPSSNYLPKQPQSLQETSVFPLDDPMAWDMSNMMAADLSETFGTNESLRMSGDSGDTSDNWNSSESSSQGQKSGSSSSRDRTRSSRSRTRKIDTYEQVPQNIVKDLHRRYFDAIHPTIPMIDESKFFASTENPHPSIELSALKNAVWAHAAAVSPIYSNLKDTFYQQAKECVEDASLEISGGALTIAALQTHILLALYEFKETLFQRAWVSVSRATWLAQMLELQKMDPERSSQRAVSFETPLIATNDPVEIKERGTTLWAAFSLHCFIGIGVGWNTGSMLDFKEITTHMPTHDSNVNISSRSLTLNDALSLPATWVLSPYQGMTVVASICMCCLSHVKQLQREKLLDSFSYDFWTEHHNLDEIIQYSSKNSLAHLVAADFRTEPNVLSLNVILQATVICLHQAVMVKAGRKNSSAHLLPNSEEECIQAATKIAAVMRLVTKANIVKWAIYVALQVTVRRLQNKPNYQQHSSEGLSKLSSAGIKSGRSGPSTNDDSLNDARELDSMHFLLSTLKDMKISSPLAQVLEGQIGQEMAAGETFTRERPVGLVNFPLTHPITRSFGDVEMDTSSQE